MDATTPAFWQFAGAYLHEDWPEVHGTVWQALEDFMRHEPQLARRLPAEIEQLLAARATESELGDYVESEGGCYLPPEGYRAWLAEVARRVSASAATG